jgi:hypothetical protein
MKLEFVWKIYKKMLKHQILLKSVQWEPKDGWTDMTKLTVALRKFANAPKKYVHSFPTRFAANSLPIPEFVVTSYSPLYKKSIIQENSSSADFVVPY